MTDAIEEARTHLAQQVLTRVQAFLSSLDPKTHPPPGSELPVTLDRLCEQAGLREAKAATRPLTEAVRETAKCLERLYQDFRRYSQELRRGLSATPNPDSRMLISAQERHCILTARALDWLYDRYRQEAAARGEQADPDQWLQEWLRYLREEEPAAPVAAHIWRLCREHGKGLAETADVVIKGEVREHCCAAVLGLAMSIERVRGLLPTEKDTLQPVRAVDVDLHGGFVRVVLGDPFDGCRDMSKEPLRGAPQECLREILEALKEPIVQLESMRPLLAATGLPLRAWLLEHRNRLFDHHLRPTHEPALSLQYLERVARAMWTLSTRIFGEGIFSYDVLADYVREPVTERVKRAACRVHCEASQSPGSPLLWLGRDTWRWERRPQHPWRMPEDVLLSLRALEPVRRNPT